MFLDGNFSVDWNNLWQTIISWISTTGLRLVIALVVLFIAFKLINFVAKRLERLFSKRHIDKTIESVLINLFRKGMKLICFIAFLGVVGIETTSFAALVASLGVGVGLALQGTLGNFAGGILLVILRPFKLGDFIESNGQAGTVEEINIFYTTIITPDNKSILIPNGNVCNGTIVNYSMKDTRRVDLTFSISYSDDFEKAKALILECVAKTGLALENPAPFVNVVSHGASSIDIVTRVWTKSSDYWTVHFNLLEAVKKSFDENGISIPFPQLDVHVTK